MKPKIVIQSDNIQQWDFWINADTYRYYSGAAEKWPKNCWHFFWQNKIPIYYLDWILPFLCGYCLYFWTLSKYRTVFNFESVWIFRILGVGLKANYSYEFSNRTGTDSSACLEHWALNVVSQSVRVDMDIDMDLVNKRKKTNEKKKKGGRHFKALTLLSNRQHKTTKNKSLELFCLVHCFAG